jgi:DhnA family fructose-bisphosphate aldolase class Ia
MAKEHAMSTTGEQIRLARLFSEGKNVVVVAVDHGLYFGPLPGMINLPEVIHKVAEADAVLFGPAMPSYCSDVFARRGSPQLIIRLNWAPNYAAQWSYRHAHSVRMLSVAEAVAQGADMVMGSLTMKNPEEAEDAQNVEVFAGCVSEKRTLGIPIVGEFYPTGGDDKSPEQLHDEVFIGCRMIAELGADLVKTFYTGKRFSEVVAATPVPILALGAKKLPKESDALRLAADAVHSGARGIVFGRNVLQSQEPKRLLEALREVVKELKPPDTVAKAFHIE